MEVQSENSGEWVTQERKKSKKQQQPKTSTASTASVEDTKRKQQKTSNGGGVSSNNSSAGKKSTGRNNYDKPSGGRDPSSSSSSTTSTSGRPRDGPRPSGDRPPVTGGRKPSGPPVAPVAAASSKPAWGQPPPTPMDSAAKKPSTTVSALPSTVAWGAVVAAKPPPAAVDPATVKNAWGLPPQVATPTAPPPSETASKTDIKTAEVTTETSKPQPALPPASSWAAAASKDASSAGSKESSQPPQAAPPAASWAAISAGKAASPAVEPAPSTAAVVENTKSSDHDEVDATTADVVKKVSDGAAADADTPIKNVEPLKSSVEDERITASVSEAMTSATQPQSQHAAPQTPPANLDLEITRNGPTSPDSNEADVESPGTISPRSDAQQNLKVNDQWSPTNTDGKRQYDRDFLLKLQTVPLSMEKPPNLPPMDIIKDKAIQNNNNNKIQSSSVNNWMPGFVKPVNTRGSLSKKSSRDGTERSVSAATKIIDIKLEEVVLHSDENAWKPTKLAEKAAEETPKEALVRKARGILNKLCPQKFDTLVDRFNELPIDTEEKLQSCIDLIFEKAVDEPGFSVAYARMCENLQKKQVMADSVGGQPQQPVEFRKLLIARCQKEFERDYMEGMDKAKYEADLAAATAAGDEAKQAELKADWEEKERRARRRSLGNIQFIGELYKLKMLTGRIMHGCINKLLKSASHEESLESLCKLLSTIGKDLEAETAEKMAKMTSENAKTLGVSMFDDYFAEIEKLSESKTFSSRVRFMLRDVIDLRKNQWKPRRDVAGPKTIDQIHKEVAMELTQQQLMNDNRGGRDREPSGGHSRNEGRKRSGRHPSNTQNPSGGLDDGWTNVQSAKTSQRFEKFDTNKIANITQSRRVDPDTIQLGSGARSMWAQGSGSQRISRTKEDLTPDVSNKFAMLHLQEPGSGQNSRDPSGNRYDNRRTGGGGGGGWPSRSMGVPGRSNSRGPSMDDDRRRAIEAVRQSMKPPTVGENDGGGSSGNVMASGPSASMGPSTHGGRPVPLSLSQANEVLEQTKLLRGKRDLSFDEVEKHTRLVLDEYLHDNNEEEAFETVCTFFHPSTMSNFVLNMINGVLERSDDARKRIGHLLSQLVHKRLLLQQQFQQGLDEVLISAEDLVVDIPKFWIYLGEIIAPLLLSKALPLKFLSDNVLAKGVNSRGKYVSAILHTLVASIGKDKVAEMWSTSGVHWELFLGKEDPTDFIRSNDLEFTTDTSSPEWLASELKKLLRQNPMTADIAADKALLPIIEWIESNVADRKKDPIFIRALMTTVAEESIVGNKESQLSCNIEILRQRINLLKRYIATDIEREKQALYALQALVHKLEHPNRLLLQFFEILYDELIVSEEALYAWEACTDQAEQAGKGVAISSTIQFFTWLKKAEDDDEDEEDEEES